MAVRRQPPGIVIAGENLLARALRVARSVHASQRDRQGRPYLEHIDRVVAAVETDEERIVAALHDAIEDSETLTLDDLRRLDFPEPCVVAVGLLTRLGGTEPYHHYLDRLLQSGNRLALRVKLADATDNLSRIEGIADPRTRERLRTRYHHSIDALRTALTHQP